MHCFLTEILMQIWFADNAFNCVYIINLLVLYKKLQKEKDVEITEQDKKFLELYSDSVYEKPSVTVDAVIFRLVDEQTDNYRKLPQKKLQVYLKKRQYPPFKDVFGVVGTFIDLNYELNDTLKLCVKSKVGLTDYYYEQLFTFGEKSRDPRTRVLSVSYLLLTNSSAEINGGEWFDVLVKDSAIKNSTTQNGFIKQKQIEIVLKNANTTLENTIEQTTTKIQLEETKLVEIKQSMLAFDHIKLIYFALERLKNKLEYTDVIFNLLNKEFTLTELKQSYELILNQKLLDANFRRKTSKYVLPTNKMVTGKGHRCSQLFVHNPNWEN